MKSVVLKQFVRKPRTTGAVLPSSSLLCKAIVSEINIESASSVAELGPGTGVVTSCILERISSKTPFFAVELNPDMLTVFKEKYPEVKVYNDSAANLPLFLKDQNLDSLDAIISGLPWASFPCKVQESILDAIIECLSPDGVFTTFAYLQGMLLPAGKKFKQRLIRHFSRVEKSQVIWRNIPPAFVYRCWK